MKYADNTAILSAKKGGTLMYVREFSKGREQLWDGNKFRENQSNENVKKDKNI